MIQDIDFLPASFHQERRQRQKRVWRRGVLIAFLALVLVGTLGQWRVRAGLEANRDGLRRQADRMAAQLHSADLLRKQIDALDARADLIAHLRLRAAPTRVLASIVGALPKFVTITELRSGYEKLEGTEDPPRKSKTKPPPGPSTLAEELDLERLRLESRQRAQFITVAGIAPDDVAVSQYLAALGQTGAFDDVRLIYTDRREYQEHRLRRFEIKLRVRSLHGDSVHLEKLPHGSRRGLPSAAPAGALESAEPRVSSLGIETETSDP